MPRKLRSHRRGMALFYAIVTAAIAASFGWQMLHGICPIP
jgi:hypothetical protein